jgi:hypothetical protein
MAGSKAEWIFGLVTAIVFGLIAVGCLIPWLMGVKLKGPNDEHATNLPFIVGFVFFGVGAGILAISMWHRTTTSGQRSLEQSLGGYIVYPDALVRMQKGGDAEIFRWSDVKEGHFRQHTEDWQLTMNSGRTVDIVFSRTRNGDPLRAVILDQLWQRYGVQYVAQIEGGETVMFGSFGVSKRGITLNGKLTDWDGIGSMKMRGYELVFENKFGVPINFFGFSLLSAPNGLIARQVVSSIAPSRLLAKV